ncbi:MAG TPA: CotH kinase family protein [Fimbriiglobus sp.]|jgi:spore coat protein CotH
MDRREFLTGTLGLAATANWAQADGQTKTVGLNDKTAELFDHPTGPVPVFRITVDKENLAQLRKDPRKYVHADIQIGSETLSNVGLHLKGAAGSSRDWNDKPALTLNSNKFKDGQSFRGLDKFHLNNSVQDGAYFNELITCERFLAMGCPAARACHAIVELNGRKVGLYVLKEGFDKVFLKRHFKDTSGNLYDGGFLQEIDQPLKLDRGTACDWKDLKALAATAREPNKSKRYAGLEKMLYFDKFYALWAGEVLGCDWDGYCRNRNNYRVYHERKSDKTCFIAHGKDQMFGNPEDGLVQGWGGLIARRLFDTPEGKKKFAASLKYHFEKHYSVTVMLKRIDDLTPRVVKALSEVNKDWGRGLENEIKGLKARIKARCEYVAKELPKLT